MTTFTTTGFGDIQAKSQLARGLVTIQMALGSVVILYVIATVVSRHGMKAADS